MGRLRKTTSELERKGAFDKNPARGRARAAEPNPTDPIGPPPEAFTNKHRPSAVEHLAAWHLHLAMLKEVKLTSADRAHLEMTCRLYVRCTRYDAATGDFAQYNKYASQLGLNPASRSLVQGVGKKTVEEAAGDWQAAAAGSSGLSVQ